jgi:hypothetical protein
VLSTRNAPATKQVAGRYLDILLPLSPYISLDDDPYADSNENDVKDEADDTGLRERRPLTFSLYGEGVRESAPRAWGGGETCGAEAAYPSGAK